MTKLMRRLCKLETIREEEKAQQLEIRFVGGSGENFPQYDENEKFDDQTQVLVIRFVTNAIYGG